MLWRVFQCIVCYNVNVRFAVRLEPMLKFPRYRPKS